MKKMTIKTDLLEEDLERILSRKADKMNTRIVISLYCFMSFLSGALIMSLWYVSKAS